MQLGDLVFLCSVLMLIVLIVRALIQLLRGRWQALKRTASLLGIFLILYAAVLFGVARSMPRRFFALGERKCFDDWCVAAISAETAENRICSRDATGSVWVATLRVSSDAKRVRQRARDASAVMEDRQGNRYTQCGPASRPLSDELAPGESFEVRLPFLLPADVRPAGLIVRHGAFPGAIIIGDDQSFTHPPALLQFQKP